MAVPYLRDVNIQPARSNAAGSQGRVQEMLLTCYTGRTSTNCNVVVEFGPTTSYGTTTVPTPLSGYHQLPFGDLTPGATYHLRVKATDPTDAGNPAYSQDYTLVQTPEVVYGGPAGPTITIGAPTGIVSSGAVINWTTAPACPPGLVLYSTSPTISPQLTKAESGGTGTAHTAPLTGLTAVTRYYYRILHATTGGASTLSELRSFVTV